MLLARNLGAVLHQILCFYIFSTERVTRPDSPRLSHSAPHDKVSNLHFFGKTRAHTVAVYQYIRCQKTGPPPRYLTGINAPFLFVLHLYPLEANFVSGEVRW